ncbi:hypothetical protein LH407_01255 [Antiquaquibacter oligotrophicus]|uniref:hypothetical protein n=1 Tax=Antiquaquibacter oligotrophicus TaxID=2880260 RepID=UPI002AC912B7|nr:hypothetical protein [Antiquaquibacter oligotrophicus]UDF13514.1 hypothetical protein LH407_01255 [Antiquaquibacter oligotrophicus]
MQGGQSARLATDGDQLVVELSGSSIEGSGTLTATAVTAEGDIEGWSIELSDGAALVGIATLQFQHDFAEGEPAPLVTSSEDGSSFEAAENVL